MPSDPCAIRIRGLGKRYHLRKVGGHSLRDALAGLFRRDPGEEFWALRDLDLDVPAGSALGIVGHNGAGKSTLLKLLSRITAPTTGEIAINGRVGSLLEVGTGFHPDLTGRENVFFNGAILGMAQAEVRRRFDEIVAFAEVERFIDMPVKTYSSGMFMRLAFSVAAHLDTEILFMDEVLAVGDAGFTQKCLRRLARATGEEGRTVLLVSHNLAAVQRLCRQALLLDHGRMVCCGDTADTLARYLGLGNGADAAEVVKRQLERNPAHADLALTTFAIRQDGRDTTVIRNGEAFEVVISFRLRAAVRGIRVGLDLRDQEERSILRTYSDTGAAEAVDLGPGSHAFRVRFPADLLAAIPYQLVLQIAGESAGILSGSDTGIRLPLQVIATGPVHRLNPMEHSMVMIAPLLAWDALSPETAP